SIGVVSVDDAAAQAGLLSFPPVLTYSEYQYEPPLVWTPDGDLIFALPPEDMFAIDPNGAPLETSLWYLPLDGSEAFQAGAVQTVEFILQEVAFSPDASRIAYLHPTGDPLG